MIKITEGKTRDHQDKEKEESHALLILSILGTFLYRVVILSALGSIYVSIKGETTSFVILVFVSIFSLLWMTIKHISDEMDKLGLENLIKNEPSISIKKTIPTEKKYIIEVDEGYYSGHGNTKVIKEAKVYDTLPKVIKVQKLLSSMKYLKTVNIIELPQ